MSIPEIMKASVIQADHKTAVVEIPIPAIDEDEILVKVVAVALNPTDWKHIDNFGKPGAISGCDFSGYVAKVGGKVENVVVGDHVAGFTHGGVYTDRGAFAEYTRVSGDLVWKVSENTLTHEEASTFGCGLWTAVQALFHPTRLNLVAPPNKAKDEEWIFVLACHPASVGLFAIQLLHRAGYKVVTVASPKNWDLLKSLGADAVFDVSLQFLSTSYHQSNDSLHAALDTIAISESQVFTVKALGPGAGKVIVILPVQSAAETHTTLVDNIVVLIYTALGREFHMYTPWPKSLEDKEQMVDFLRKFPHFVSSGQIKSNPIRPVEGGIDGIVAGLDVLRQGKNSGEKLVVRISP